MDVKIYKFIHKQTNLEFNQEERKNLYILFKGKPFNTKFLSLK